MAGCRPSAALVQHVLILCLRGTIHERAAAAEHCNSLRTAISGLPMCILDAAPSCKRMVHSTAQGSRLVSHSRRQ
jgi:hypothetical protein